MLWPSPAPLFQWRRARLVGYRPQGWLLAGVLRVLQVLRQEAPLQRAGWAWRVSRGPYAQPRRWLWVPKQAQLQRQLLGLGWRLGLGPRPQDA